MSTPSVSFLLSHDCVPRNLIELYPAFIEENQSFKIAGTLRHCSDILSQSVFLFGESDELTSVQIDGVEQSKLSSEQVKERLQSIGNAIRQKNPNEMAKLNGHILNIIKT